MKLTTRVDLHCHSVFSDGSLTPREIADALSSDGVTAAALADHDSVEGLAEFKQTLARREVGFISGVEITTQCNGEETHLLAYGFDSANPEIQKMLRSLRQARAQSVQSIEESIRRQGSNQTDHNGINDAVSGGQIDIIDAIDVVHRAGGFSFLAHPFITIPDFNKLESLLIYLKEKGLDGIEAIYEPFSAAQQLQLCAMAKKLGLLVSAGTDTHDLKSPRQHPLGIEMPTELWKEFRDRVCSFDSKSPNNVSRTESSRLHRRFNLQDFIFHFVFPTLLAIAMFITAIYAIFLPTFERSLMDRKKEMIRELTNSAWSILNGYEQDERAGRLTRAQAQSMAISRIQSLRYGREGKDYFWLQDLYPHIIMHPYRRDLNGKDVSNFQDLKGTRIFVEFADVVRRSKEGYVKYFWQWKDDPKRLVPKESYIKGFAPWGWIIGTGIYIEDVKQEIKQIEHNLVNTSLGISLIIILLLLYVIRRSLSLEQDRAEAEESLYESTERYRSLVEATTEGTLLVMDGRCRYANPIFLEMINYTQNELEFMDLSDIFPKSKENEDAWNRFKLLLDGNELADGFDAVIRQRNGSLIECVMAASQITFAEKSGFILLVRNVSHSFHAANTQDRLNQRWRNMLKRINELEESIEKLQTSKLQKAVTPEEVAGCCKEVPELAKALLDSGAHPHHITRMISSVCDTAAIKLISFAEEKLGKSPVPFVFLALGSHGRQEMTLASDQDNAIIYTPSPYPEVQQKAEEYLNELSSFVCEWLEQAGYPMCPGKVMANNSKWCKPISVWKQYFSDWIALPEPQQLLDFTIFFDFRPIYGSIELSKELRHHVFEELRSHPSFYPHFAQNALLFKPPIRLLGRIIADSHGNEQTEQLDLKDAMMPIVSFARLYALRLDMDDTHTINRLNVLLEASILNESSANEIEISYDFLMRLRLQHQAAELISGNTANNIISYRRLVQVEQTMLNQSFAQITAVQKRISYDFLGGTI